MTDSRRNTDYSSDEDNLTAFLRSQTTWVGPSPELFRKAFSPIDGAPVSPLRRPRFPRLGRPVLFSAAAVLLLAIGIGLLTPELGKARQSSRPLQHSMVMSAPSDEAEKAARTLGGARVDAHGKLDRSADIEASADRSADMEPSADRLVVRKATIELLSADVRAAFSKARHVLRADLGEFAEAATLSGQDDFAQAQLTLRVSAIPARLEQVLNELRAIGKVQSENATGDDVTVQAVDLDARLRNERRVETEVLELLETRKDAPLKEILDLRDKLSQIRQSIETMQARRDTLGRQVALATILVIIRADAKATEKPVDPEPSFFVQIATRLSDAADRGARTFVASIAFALELLIAGALWWALLVAVLLLVRRHLARQPKVAIGPDPAR